MLRLPEFQPDWNRFLKAVRREGEPDRVPFCELFHDNEIIDEVMARMGWEPDVAESEAEKARLRKRVEFWRLLGYDYLTLTAIIPFARRTLRCRDVALFSRGEREWADERRGAIETREDFEKYPWPTPRDVDYSQFEFVEKILPEGMKVMGLTGGVLEWAMWIMGYEPLCYALEDDPELVEQVFARVGELVLAANETLATMDMIGALWLGDDMGFKHATMLSPELLRKLVLPWHRRIAQAAHAAGKPFLLHSCGNLTEIMDDLIDYVGIDAKHSFEDVIEPVTEAKRRYGGRIALLGGIDMDLLARGTEEQVRRRTREVLEACAPGGGYALGSGNTVANYVKVENFLAMLDEGLRYGA